MRRFECFRGGSSKFWSAYVEGSTLHTFWGRIGTAGLSKSYECSSSVEACRRMVNAIQEKLGKGYEEVKEEPNPFDFIQEKAASNLMMGKLSRTKVVVEGFEGESKAARNARLEAERKERQKAAQLKKQQEAAELSKREVATRFANIDLDDDD